MIKYKTGDILQADVEALVNTVNCVGIMGRGIALQFKEAYPANFKAYAAACDRGEVEPGRMFVFDTGFLTNPRFIINFPTKRHWKGKSRIEDIEAGLAALIEVIRERRIRSIAVPPLGSGLGGLAWPDVRRRIERALSDMPDVDVVVFEPNGKPERQSATRPTAIPNMTAGRAALIVLMQRYLGGLMDPFVTLLEVHKLMYFMQEAGQKLRLRYSKAPFGPFADNLGHVLRQVEGHFVSGYADGGDAPDKQLRLVPGSVADAESLLHDDADTTARFSRVADLVSGFETPFGLELLSTVHWVATREAASSIEQIVERTYAWNERKQQFSQRQIALAFDVLAKKGWLSSPDAPVGRDN